MCSAVGDRVLSSKVWQRELLFWLFLNQFLCRRPDASGCWLDSSPTSLWPHAVLQVVLDKMAHVCLSQIIWELMFLSAAVFLAFISRLQMFASSICCQHRSTVTITRPRLIRHLCLHGCWNEPFK